MSGWEEDPLFLPVADRWFAATEAVGLVVGVGYRSVPTSQDYVRALHMAALGRGSSLVRRCRGQELVEWGGWVVGGKAGWGRQAGDVASALGEGTCEEGGVGLQVR